VDFYQFQDGKFCIWTKTSKQTYFKFSYYGGENASLNIDQLYEKFEGKDVKPPKEFGKPRDWNVDLIPKFVMAGGLLMKLLQSCGITNLDFTLVEGSYVVIKDKIQKVPSNITEVANSSLMSFWEKNRCRKFLQEEKNTHGGNILHFKKQVTI
jgi:Rab GDP dissociation inhibitor